MDYLKTYIKAAHPDDTKAFVFQLKAAAQRVSVALQRSTAQQAQQQAAPLQSSKEALQPQEGRRQPHARGAVLAGDALPERAVAVERHDFARALRAQRRRELCVQHARREVREPAGKGAREGRVPREVARRAVVRAATAAATVPAATAASPAAFDFAAPAAALAAAPAAAFASAQVAAIPV